MIKIFIPSIGVVIIYYQFFKYFVCHVIILNPQIFICFFDGLMAQQHLYV